MHWEYCIRPPARGAGYCDECVLRESVCLPVRQLITDPNPNFAKFSLRVACGRGHICKSSLVLDGVRKSYSS